MKTNGVEKFRVTDWYADVRKMVAKRTWRWASQDDQEDMVQDVMFKLAKFEKGIKWINANYVSLVVYSCVSDYNKKHSRYYHPQDQILDTIGEFYPSTIVSEIQQRIIERYSDPSEHLDVLCVMLSDPIGWRNWRKPGCYSDSNIDTGMNYCDPEIAADVIAIALELLDDQE